MCGFACPLRAHPASLSVAALTPAAQLDGGIWEGDLQRHCLARSWIIHYIVRLIKDEEPAATIRYAAAPPAQTILELLISTEMYQGGDASALWLHLFWAAVLSQWELTWVRLSHQFRRSTAEQLAFYHLKKWNVKVTCYSVPFPPSPVSSVWIKRRRERVASRNERHTYWCIQEALAVHSQIEFGLHPLDSHHSQAHWNKVEHGWRKRWRAEHKALAFQFKSSSWD